MTAPDQLANVRYLVDNVAAAVEFYTAYLGFTVRSDAAPAFADVRRGPLRLLLSGPTSSGARATPADAAAPVATGFTSSPMTSTPTSTACGRPDCLSAAS